MSAEAVGWVWKFSPYKKVDRLIHLALADSANDMNDNEIWARQQWIADKAGVSRSSVNSWIGQAVDDGFLELLEDNAKLGKPNRYRFLMPVGAAQLWEPRRGGVESVDRGVSNPWTGGVESVDTEPKRNPTREPNPSDLASKPGIVEPEQGTLEGVADLQPEALETEGPLLVEAPPSDAKRVYDAWVEIMGKDPKRAKLTGERRTKINARLRSGELGVQDLIDAIKGAKANPWMMGKNDRNTVYDDIVTILKNDESANRHARYFREGGSVVRPAAPNTQMSELQRLREIEAAKERTQP